MMQGAYTRESSMNQIIHMYFADSLLATRNDIVSSFYSQRFSMLFYFLKEGFHAPD